VSRWSIHLCGELRVEFAGARREAQLRGRQGRLAFAYLVLHRARPVRRDELIEALWAHEGAPPSDTALAPVLSRLRRAVEPAVLEGRDTLRLVFPAPVWVDVEAISGYLAAARAGLDCAPTSRSSGSRPWSWSLERVWRAGATHCRPPSAPPARRSRWPRFASPRARR
jgi:DNA-binding SARP family transcriptional activator